MRTALDLSLFTAAQFRDWLIVAGQLTDLHPACVLLLVGRVVDVRYHLFGLLERLS